MSQYTSYYLYQKYEKRGEQDWIPCYPNTYSISGDATNPMSLVVKSENDTQCGYTPTPTEPMYRWVNLNPSTDYYCDGVAKYYKQQRQVSYDGGTTWSNLNEYQRGSQYEASSSDCGGGTTMYRWVNLDPTVEYYCSNHNKYYKQQKQVSYDNGTTWSNLDEYQRGEIYENNSSDCQSPEISTDLVGSSEGKVLMYELQGDRLVISEDEYNLTNYPLEQFYPVGVSLGDGEYCSLKLGNLFYDEDMLKGIENDADLLSWGYVVSNWHFRSCTVNAFTSADDWRNIADFSFPLNSKDPRSFQMFKCADIFVLPGTSKGDWKVPSVSQLQKAKNNEWLFNSIKSINNLLCNVIIVGNSAHVYPSWEQTCGILDGVEVYDANVCGFALGNIACGIVVGKIYLDKNCSYDAASAAYNSSHRLLPILKITSNSYKGNQKISIGSSHKAICRTINGDTYYIPTNVFKNLLTSAEIEAVVPVSSVTSYTFSDEIDTLSGHIFTSKYIEENIDMNKVNALMYNPFNRNSKIKTINFNFNKYGYDSGEGWIFEKMSGLTSITINGVSTAIPTNIQTIGNSAFARCSSLRNVVIPSSVTKIGSSAFVGCSSLTSITIPNSVTTIDDWAFTDCSSLSSVTIGSGVRQVNRGAFSGCTSLTSIEIPSSVTTIGNYAFLGCSGLTSIIVNAVSPPVMAIFANRANAFDDTNNAPILVPAASVDVYKSASGWSDYASRIQPIT